MRPKKDVNTSAGDPKEIQKTNTISKNDELVTILSVDSLRRLAKVTSVSGAEIDVHIAQNLNTLDLPPTKENWMGIADLNASIPVLKYIIPPQGASEDPAVSIHTKQKEVHESITSTEKTYNSVKNKSQKHSRYDRPTDLIPGDSGIKSSDGNIIAALRGWINILKASVGVQFIQSALHRLTRIITNSFELWTGWGVININNLESKTKLYLACSSKHENVRKNKFDLELELGDCSDPDQFLTIKFKHLKNMDAEFVLNISNTGEIYLSTPEMMTEQIHLHKYEIVGKQSVETVNELKKIESESGLWKTKGGNGSLSLGDVGTYPADALVTKPHLDKYKQLLDAVTAMLRDPTLLGMPGVSFFPTAAPFLAQLMSQAPTVDNDKTNITVAK
jgi:hypothetical protein